MLAVGSKAPAFELKTLDGEVVTLADTLREGPSILTFFKISCPTCQLAMPFLQRMAGSDRARMIAISQDDAEGTREFNGEFGIAMPALLDYQGHKTAKAFEITHVPSTFVVERDGSISKSFMGFSKDDYEELGARLGVPPFKADEQVPRFKAG